MMSPREFNRHKNIVVVRLLFILVYPNYRKLSLHCL